MRECEKEKDDEIKRAHFVGVWMSFTVVRKELGNAKGREDGDEANNMVEKHLGNKPVFLLFL